MKKFLISIIAFLGLFLMAQNAKSDEGIFYGGGTLAYQFDNQLLGIEARGGYNFTDKLAGQLQGTFYFIGNEDNQNVYSISPSIRYNFVQMKKIGFYGRLGYTYFAASVDNPGDLSDRKAEYHQFNIVPGFMFPIKGIDFFGEIDLPIQFAGDGSSGLRSVFRIGAQFNIN